MSALPRAFICERSFTMPSAAGVRRSIAPGSNRCNERLPPIASVEVDDRRSAADLLDPDVLDAVSRIQIQIGLRDDHLSGERFVVPIPLPVEVREQHHGLVIGLSLLEELGSGAGALEA